MASSLNKCLKNTEGSSLMSVLADYAPLVKSRALFFMSEGVELEDLIQEGNIGLLSATYKFDESLSAFSTFARKCIDSAIIDYLRKNNRKSVIPTEKLVHPEDENGFDIPDSSPNPEHEILVKEEYNEILEKAKTKLSELEYSVFGGLVRGDSHAEIAAQNGVEIKAVRNAVQRIRAKLK